eukprot:s2682_g10.t1
MSLGLACWADALGKVLNGDAVAVGCRNALLTAHTTAGFTCVAAVKERGGSLSGKTSGSLIFERNLAVPSSCRARFQISAPKCFRFLVVPVFV